jgi:hypothetical protein
LDSATSRHSASAQSRFDRETETGMVVAGEPLPLEVNPYTHALSEGAFSFKVPRGWQVVEEDENSVLIASSDQNSYLGGLFVNLEQAVGDDKFQSLSDRYTDFLTKQYTEQPVKLIDKMQGQVRLVALRYPILSGSETETEQPSVDCSEPIAHTGCGDIDLYFEPQEDTVFILYLVTNNYQQLATTWRAIRESQIIDPVKAVESLEDNSLAFGPLWLRPTPTPSGPKYDIPPGKGLFLFTNNAGFTIILDIINPKTQQTLVEAQRIDPKSSRSFFLDPGEYTYRATKEGANVGVQEPPIFYLGEGEVLNYSVN